MRFTDCVTRYYSKVLGGKSERHQAWITQVFNLAEIPGVAHLAVIQANNQLDLIIRQLEEEWEQPPKGSIDLPLNLRISLSECWVLRAYEVVRAASAQLHTQGAPNEKLAVLKRRMGGGRIPIAKGEIQGMGKKARSEERRVGKEGVKTGRSRWS